MGAGDTVHGGPALPRDWSGLMVSLGVRDSGCGWRGQPRCVGATQHVSALVSKWCTDIFCSRIPFRKCEPPFATRLKGHFTLPLADCERSE